MRRRLLILSNGIYPDRVSGTPYWCSLLAPALQPWWHVTVLAPSDAAPQAPCRPVERSINDIRLLTWRETARARNDYIYDYFEPELDAALSDLLNVEKPEAILVLNFGGSSATIAALCIERALPLYYFINDVSPFCFHGYFNRPMQGRCEDSRDGRDCSECLQHRKHEPSQAKVAALRLWSKALLRAFAGIATPTRWFGERLIHEIGDEDEASRLHVIRYGLPAARRISDRPPGEPQILGFFGGSRPRKGGRLLIDALCLIHRDRPELKFRVHWLGDGVPDIPSALHQSIVVRGLLSVSALLQELDTIDVSVFPSFGEVFPLTMLQSLQRGVPVIATDLGGYREILTPEVDALLVGQRPEALADAITTFLEKRTQLSVRYDVPSVDCAAAAINDMLRTPRPPRVTARELAELVLAVSAFL